MFFQALLLALICGITEFLPVSSNGHVIILGELMAFKGPPGKLFEISLQLGAICAVCWYYRNRLAHMAACVLTDAADRKFAINVGIACIPATLVGAAFHHFITEHLFHAYIVASMLVAGGIVMLLVEKYKPAPKWFSPDDISLKQAIWIGLCQMLAMVPGVSRSGATIMGAMAMGIERRAATEFSFFLAIPMMFMATFFDIFVHRHEITSHGLTLIASGFTASFIAASIVVRWLLGYLSRHGFTAFGWYRIIVGTLVLMVLGFSRT